MCQGAVYGTGTGKWAVIFAFAFFCAPVFANLWEGMFGPDQYVWKAFVIPQKHIIAGFELFDQVLFKQQCLSFGACGQKHHARRFRDHPVDAARMTRWPRIAGDPHF